MSRTEITELTVLCLVQDGDRYLLQHRLKKDWPGFTLPGGHIEPGESIVDAVIREVKEETGLTLKKYQYRGLITFVSNQWGTEYMHLFTATEYEGEIKECDEGNLEWVPKSKIEQLNLWEGDKIFLRLIEQKVPFFSLKLEYQGEKLINAVLNGEKL